MWRESTTHPAAWRQPCAAHPPPLLLGSTRWHPGCKLFTWRAFLARATRCVPVLCAAAFRGMCRSSGCSGSVGAAFFGRLRRRLSDHAPRRRMPPWLAAWRWFPHPTAPWPWWNFLLLMVRVPYYRATSARVQLACTTYIMKYPPAAQRRLQPSWGGRSGVACVHGRASSWRGERLRRLIYMWRESSTHPAAGRLPCGAHPPPSCLGRLAGRRLLRPCGARHIGGQWYVF